MLTAAILPSAATDPGPVVVAFWLLNPLLNARFESKMQATRRKFLANGYSYPELHTLAVELQRKRNHIHCTQAVEPADKEAMHDLLDLLQSTHLSREEAKDLRPRILTARPSEYAWLRKPIEAAITTRAEAATEKLLAAA